MMTSTGLQWNAFQWLRKDTERSVGKSLPWSDITSITSSSELSWTLWTSLLEIEFSCSEIETTERWSSQMKVFCVWDKILHLPSVPLQGEEMVEFLQGVTEFLDCSLSIKVEQLESLGWQVGAMTKMQDTISVSPLELCFYHDNMSDGQNTNCLLQAASPRHIKILLQSVLSTRGLITDTQLVESIIQYDTMLPWDVTSTDDEQSSLLMQMCETCQWKLLDQMINAWEDKAPWSAYVNLQNGNGNTAMLILLERASKSASSDRLKDVVGRLLPHVALNDLHSNGETFLHLCLKAVERWYPSMVPELSSSDQNSFENLSFDSDPLPIPLNKVPIKRVSFQVSQRIGDLDIRVKLLNEKELENVVMRSSSSDEKEALDAISASARNVAKDWLTKRVGTFQMEKDARRLLQERKEQGEELTTLSAALQQATNLFIEKHVAQSVKEAQYAMDKERRALLVEFSGFLHPTVVESLKI